MRTFRTGESLLESERREQGEYHVGSENGNLVQLVRDCEELSESLHNALLIWQKICLEEERRYQSIRMWLLRSSYVAAALLLGSQASGARTLKAINERMEAFFAREELPIPTRLENIESEKLTSLKKAAKDEAWAIIFQINQIATSNIDIAPIFFTDQDIPIYINGACAQVDMSLLVEDYGVLSSAEYEREYKINS